MNDTSEINASKTARAPNPGEPAPWFKCPVYEGNPRYSFDTAAGRTILMLFFGSAAQEGPQKALQAALDHCDIFSDSHCAFFGVTVDPADAKQGRLTAGLPGMRIFLDYDQNISRSYGAIDPQAPTRYRPQWLLLDRALRLVGRYPLEETERALRNAEALSKKSDGDAWAPVLEVPNILEPELCSRLIAAYDADGGTDSGFMREVDGKTVYRVDHGHKRRSDVHLHDPELRRMLVARVERRLVPMIRRAFQFEATRMERYVVACYDAKEGGHFNQHRDNTTSGTAHRRFAVTINLNTGDYEGGDLMFPEFGRRTYCAPRGGAIVFSCSLLHRAMPVTSGRRYAFLPFLYDEAAAQIRLANNGKLGEGVTEYRMVG